MCAWAFGDSFDCYALPADAIAGYWDSGSLTGGGGVTLAAGRFAGGQCMQFVSSSNTLVKASGVNDAVHHIFIAVRDPLALTGTSAMLNLQLADGVTPQCSIVFRSDGAMLLTSGLPTGTTLATYTGAITVQSAWTSFEIEVLISPTAGYMNVRKNGNTVNDFTSATNLNTRPGANNYANKLTVGIQTTPSTNWAFDDLLWRSDAASVPWVGDIRCIARMPVSDASVTFTRTAGATNASCVDEPQQNALTDYVFDAVAGDADFYNIGTIASTPLATVAVTTRAFMSKSDAGARTGAVQIKSGGTTVASPTLALATTFGWTWRTDTTDPATGAAWTAAAVNTVQCGPKTVA